MNPLELRDTLRQHHLQSFGWALCCCHNNRHQAQDVLQTVYLKILEGKACFDGRSAFKTWLFSVIRKTSADEQRRSFFRRMKFSPLEEHIEAYETVEDAMIGSEQLAIIQSAFTQLPQRQRQVLQLVFYHDLTLQETAGAMRISVGSVRKHYERGKKKIRTILEESHAFVEPRPGPYLHRGILPTPEAGS
ncbi:MAG: sigma-70 family RNA polymerase sigma factor [Ignavibacteriales bacterium]|nr:sigma-70 family RNA polymerase sigma factor [Ignavibacteriales bacterium]